MVDFVEYYAQVIHFELLSCEHAERYWLLVRSASCPPLVFRGNCHGEVSLGWRRHPWELRHSPCTRS
jgi:hypothetical protein